MNYRFFFLIFACCFYICCQKNSVSDSESIQLYLDGPEGKDTLLVNKNVSLNIFEAMTVGSNSYLYFSEYLILPNTNGQARMRLYLFRDKNIPRDVFLKVQGHYCTKPEQIQLKIVQCILNTARMQQPPMPAIGNHNHQVLFFILKISGLYPMNLPISKRIE